MLVHDHMIQFGLAIFSVFVLIGADVQANEESSGHAKRHHLAVFAGAGFEQEDGHSENGSALGIKYEFLFSESWNVGVDLEKLYGSETDRSIIVAIPISFHINENWSIFMGPGYEFHGKKDKALIRTGAAYHWELKDGWSLSPEVIADFLEGGAKTYVAGLSIGREF